MSTILKFTFILFGIAAFMTVAIFTKERIGIPFDTILRVACIIVCLWIMVPLAREYEGQRWPWVATLIATILNLLILFTPLVDRPASRGELMIFAMPDAVVFLLARTITYHAETVHEKAVRQQLILGTILAVAICAIQFYLILIDSVSHN